MARTLRPYSTGRGVPMSSPGMDLNKVIQIRWTRERCDGYGDPAKSYDHGTLEIVRALDDGSNETFQIRVYGMKGAHRTIALIRNTL